MKNILLSIIALFGMAFPQVVNPPSGGSGGPTTFDQIGSGTNTTAGLVCGSGCVLTTASGGFVNANEINGLVIPASATVLGTNSSSQPVAATTTGTGTTVVLSAAPTFTGNVQGAQLSFSGNINSSGGTVTGTNIKATENTVTFSATPTFTANTLSNIITLTGSLTSWTISTGASGQPMTLTFCQNATGAFTTGTTPANVHGFFTIGATASKCSSQSFNYSVVQTAWVANSPGVTNE